MPPSSACKRRLHATGRMAVVVVGQHDDGALATLARGRSATSRSRTGTRTASRPTRLPRQASTTTRTTWTRTTPTGSSAPNVPGPAEAGAGQPGLERHRRGPAQLAHDPRLERRLHDRAAARARQAGCVQNDESSMIDPNGNVRIRATGRSAGEKRSIVATYKRKGFLDYLYFTDYETLDPYAYSPSRCQPGAQRTASSTTTSARRRLHGDPLHRRRRGGRSAAHQRLDSRVRRAHVRPHVADNIEFSGPTPSGTRRVRLRPRPEGLRRARQSGQLAAAAVQPRARRDDRRIDYQFTGNTTIVLNGATMTVTNARSLAVHHARTRSRPTAWST